MKTKWELTVWRLKDRIKKGISALNKVVRNNREDSIDTVGAQITSEVNTILRGSKLVGDIKIANDLELSGDVEGNITSDKRSNITIKGNCRGSISTQKGNVEIEGAILNGDIVAGGYVKVRGKFNGGKIEAREKIYMDGEFTGLLQSNEIEVGPSSRGKGELLYTEHISIHKGARVDVQIRKIGEEQRETKRSAENKVIDLDVPFQQKST